MWINLKNKEKNQVISCVCVITLQKNREVCTTTSPTSREERKQGKELS